MPGSTLPYSTQNKLHSGKKSLKSINMETGLSHLHSLLRWVLLLLLIIAIVKSFSKDTYTEGNRKLALFTLIMAHVQLILGVSLYFIKGLILEMRLFNLSESK